MTAPPSNVLVVDDDIDTADLICEGLRRRGFRTHAAYSVDDALARLASVPAEVVVTDVQMPTKSGIDLCRELRRAHPDVVAIVVTGVGKVDTAIEAMRESAFDFLQKPASIEVLTIAVHRAVEHQRLRAELKRLRMFAAESSAVGIVGDSTPIRETLELVQRVATSDATVLITGESGTGKELVARAVHSLSANRHEPFIAINCAAMPPALLESELFGHVRGAFTDAKSSRTGLFAQAGRGTLFLDEIGEMPMEMQVKLLRVLQERKVRPVGSDTEHPIEARVVTATNRDLEREVEARRFRQDLYYRINVVAIAVPPLRARPGDVLVLAQHFLRRSAVRSAKPVTGISEAAARALIEYEWPGNVRELENCVERAVAICQHDQITVSDLPSRMLEDRIEPVVATGDSKLLTLEEMERRYVRQVLEAVRNNKTRAAQILGIDRRSIYRRIENEKAIADRSSMTPGLRSSSLPPASAKA